MTRRPASKQKPVSLLQSSRTKLGVLSRAGVLIYADVMSLDLTRQGSTVPSSLKHAQIYLIQRHLAVLRSGTAFALIKYAELYINSRCKWEILYKSKESFDQTSCHDDRGGVIPISIGKVAQEIRSEVSVEGTGFFTYAGRVQSNIEASGDGWTVGKESV